ncbi:hypothetical protein D0869_05344 [Hortaea werneckii]|uniref:Uncharacterized protein n=1 Tax=Hortaea werneckii TaxID=91943 RepID=A0A3M6YXS8_HORWE|nr:hypothetical protein D0869_05344 [Hortaea werneckii]RMY07571.1 hypothetical protein D0868_05284 [Hortaea werneckii]
MRMAQYGLEREGTKGVTPWRQRVKDYRSFKSSYGPEYVMWTFCIESQWLIVCAQLQDRLPRRWSQQSEGPILVRPTFDFGFPLLRRKKPLLTLEFSLTLAGGFGGVAGIFALFFFNGIPKVQQDILQKVPFIGDFFKHEIAPEDNPF